jgi:hypothetical protein
MKGKFSKFVQIRVHLSRLGVTIRKKDTGEYRVNFVGGREETAYYSEDLDDAYGTGQAMAENAAGRPPPPAGTHWALPIGVVDTPAGPVATLAPGQAHRGRPGQGARRRAAGRRVAP